MSQTTIKIKRLGARDSAVHGHTHRLWMGNFYQDLTYDDLVKVAVEALDAVRDGDAKKIWKARKP